MRVTTAAWCCCCSLAVGDASSTSSLQAAIKMYLLHVWCSDWRALLLDGSLFRSTAYWVLPLRVVLQASFWLTCWECEVWRRIQYDALYKKPAAALFRWKTLDID